MIRVLNWSLFFQNFVYQGEVCLFLALLSLIDWRVIGRKSCQEITNSNPPDMPKISVQRIHISRSYTIHEIALLLGVSRRTIQRWLLDGLIPIDQESRPILVGGVTLRKFIKDKVRNKKAILQENEFYCFRCRLAVEAKPGSDSIMKTGIIVRSSGKEQVIRIGKCKSCAGIVRRFLKYQ
jgi:hypothetical protein